MKLKQLQQEHGLLFQKFKNAPRECYEPSCKTAAINSHILQKNGVLTQIQEENHVYSLSTNQITGELAFRRIGVNNAFSFKGFCNHHDTTIFSSIEQESFEANDYKNQLLLCYRGILNEQRKKEVLIDLHTTFLSNSKTKDHIDSVAVRRLITNERHAIKDFIELSTYIANDLSSDTESFYFSHKVIDRLDVCTSATFNVETREDMLRLSTQGRLHERLNSIIVNILPYRNKTLILIGCLIKSIDKCLPYYAEFNKDPFKFSSDILLKHIETWVCSPTFYLQTIKPIEKDFLHEFSLYPTFKPYSAHTRINIFSKISPGL